MTEQIFSTAHSAVKQLVEDFQVREQDYLSPSYPEIRVRQDFIDKFWIALGWDVNHEREKNPYEQEVKIELNVKVDEQGNRRTKKADYAFFAAPNFRDVKFYVEAKKPSRNLDNADDYFQTIRYGWSSNTPLAVLTDFEQFRVIDCRYKPNIATAQNFALEDVKYNYRDYADEEKFRRIYHLFSRESVINGSLEDYTKNLPKRGKGAKQGKLFGTAIQKSVDESFLDDLDGFRAELARAFKNKNAELDGEDLTEAVTRTLDRLVFIRFLEDKLIEPDTMIDKFNSWADFVRTSRNLEGRYNGIVFKKHFIDSDDFKPGEKVFTDICGELSPKDSPYNFNYIPVHILGSIYERFLGKVIDNKGKVETKPEVRKAGGVYYTPEYIVRYIVENTIGKLIENKTPEAIKEMRFADIACGSGSFLLGVYDYLLRYHTNYYNETFTAKTRTEERQREARKAKCIENADGSFILSIAQRREILRNNIYGVDVDAQATEVAQLSLALKLLEDATLGAIRVFQPKLGEKILPDMTKNIVCGNSLVDHDILDGQLFERNEERKLNPMSYEDKFPFLKQSGGFDAIVGNPPYVRQELLGATVKNYFQKKYATYHGVADLYVYFFEKYLAILKQEGVFGIIVGSKWLRVKYGEPLRRFLKKQRIEEISDFGALPVFQGATTYPAIIRVSKAEPQPTFPVANIETLDFSDITLSEHINERRFNVNQATLDNGGWSLNDETSQTLLDKLRKVGVPLEKYVDGNIYYGIKTGLNEAFVIDVETRERLIAENAKSAEIIKPFLAGRDVRRYVSPKSDKFVIFTRRGINIKNYPAIENYLRQFYLQLLPKPKDWEKTKKKDEKWEGRKEGSYQWYEIQDTVDYFPMFDETKILFPGISAEVTAFAMDFNKYYGNDNNQLIVTDSKYLLGILNSQLSKFLLTTICDKVQGGFYRLKIIYIAQLPIRVINFANKTEKAMHDKMVALVEQMLETKKQLQTARTDKDKNFYQDRCNALDRQIDEMVYDLYELTDDEREIVKSKA